MTYTAGQAVLSGTGAAKTFLDNISIGQTVDLNLQVLSATSGITNIKQLTGGWTRLILDGANCVTASVADESGPVPDDLAPRTAIGYNQTKDKIYLVVNDGRNTGVSEGMTLSQLAGLLIVHWLLPGPEPGWWRLHPPSWEMILYETILPMQPAPGK